MLPKALPAFWTVNPVKMRKAVFSFTWTPCKSKLFLGNKQAGAAAPACSLRTKKL